MSAFVISTMTSSPNAASIENLIFSILTAGIVHTHERPVLETPIDVIYEDEDMLVVNKPASMLIYPSHGYRQVFNRIMNYLVSFFNETVFQTEHSVIHPGKRSGPQGLETCSST